MSSERNPLLHDDFHDPYADQDGNLEATSVADGSYDSSEIASFESIHCVNEVYRSVPQIDSRYYQKNILFDFNGISPLTF